MLCCWLMPVECRYPVAVDALSVDTLLLVDALLSVDTLLLVDALLSVDTLLLVDAC